VTRPSRLAAAERGQAAVEVALAMPLVVVLLLALVQVVIVGRDQVAVVHAAREGARAAAVAAEPVTAGQRAAREAIGLPTERTSVVVEAAGEVRVTVVHRAITDVPLVGRFVGDVAVRGTAVMRREP
jgi:Flp pilus assembly protein TadG